MGEFFRSFFSAILLLLKKWFGPRAPEQGSDHHTQPIVQPPDHILTIAPTVVARVEPTFTETELPALAEQLNLEALGRENGRKNLPASDSTGLDPVERQILAVIQQRIGRARAEYESAAQCLGTAAVIAEISVCRTRIRGMVEEALTDLRARARARREDVFLFLEAARRCKQEVETFRTENRLQRQAWTDRSHGPQLTLLSGLLAAESILNGTLLSRGLEGGLIAGWLTAAALAALNTGIAFAARWALRIINHVRVMIRAAGLTLAVIWLLWTVGFNLGVAHYRDALNSDNPDIAGTVALQDLFSHPWRIRDFQSASLLSMGLVFSLIALCDGFATSDPYPGYEAVTRKWEEASKEFHAARQRAEATLTQRKDDALAAVRSEIDYLPVLESRLRDAGRRRADLAERWEREIERLERAANVLAEIYREANRRARTAPAPAHFDMPLEMPRPDNPVTAVALDGDDPPEDFGPATAAILREYEAAIQSLLTLEEL